MRKDRDSMDRETEMLIEALSQLSAIHEKVDMLRTEMEKMKTKQEELDDRYNLIDKSITLNTSITKNLEQKIDAVEPLKVVYTKAQGIAWLFTKVIVAVCGLAAALKGLSSAYEVWFKHK